MYGGGDDGDSGMGEGVPGSEGGGGEGGGGEGEGSSTPAARTIGSHCGGLAPPRMKSRVFELRGKTAREGQELMVVGGSQPRAPVQVAAPSHQNMLGEKGKGTRRRGGA